MRLDRAAYLLYAVTDRDMLKGYTLTEAVDAACAGGATMVQIREKKLGDPAFLAEAIGIKVITDKYNIPLIINDDVEVAIESGAAGVHVGQGDMAAGDVRRMIGENMILGVSAHTLEEAEKAVADGADYLGVGAVFSTSTKLDASAVSIDRLKQICQTIQVPVVAIGGINQSNALLLKGSGIAGLAIVSAIFAAGDIGGAAGELAAIAKGVVI